MFKTVRVTVPGQEVPVELDVVRRPRGQGQPDEFFLLLSVASEWTQQEARDYRGMAQARVRRNSRQEARPKPQLVSSVPT